MLAEYTNLVLYRTEHPEKYWKVLSMWLEWWRLESHPAPLDAPWLEYEVDLRVSIIRYAMDEFPKVPQGMFHLWQRGVI